MTDTIFPPYAKYGDIALCHAIASLLADVRERKNEPHCLNLLFKAMSELNGRARDACGMPTGCPECSGNSMRFTHTGTVRTYACKECGNEWRVDMAAKEK